MQIAAAAPEKHPQSEYQERCTPRSRQQIRWLGRSAAGPERPGGSSRRFGGGGPGGEHRGRGWSRHDGDRRHRHGINLSRTMQRLITQIGHPLGWSRRQADPAIDGSGVGKLRDRRGDESVGANGREELPYASRTAADGAPF